MPALAHVPVTRPSDLPVRRDVVSRTLKGRYEMIRLLGRGGMGAVYLARDRVLQRHVAIKIVEAGAGAPLSLVAGRFLVEARAAARLQHPNIVPIFDFGDGQDAPPHLVMAYVHGESLAGRLLRDVRLSVAQAAGILADIAEGLDYAHRRGVIHRDVKPENILLDAESGRAVLTDFGVAGILSPDRRLPDGQPALGTPLFTAPEQMWGDPHADWRCDLYALGVVGFAMLAGRPPFTGASVQAVMVQHATAAPPPLRSVRPDAPHELAALIDRCLAKEPLRRAAAHATIHDTMDVPGLRSIASGGGRLSLRARVRRWFGARSGSTGR